MTQAPGKGDSFAGFALDTDDGETSETVRERMELALETADGVIWDVVVTEGRDGGARCEIRGVETDTGGRPAA